MTHYATLTALHRANGFPPPQHPLFSMLICKEPARSKLGNDPFTTDCYMISLKRMKSGTVRYGKTKYDHDAGALAFVKPRQAIQFNRVELFQEGFVLFIHEDYLLGHALHADIRKYGFFDYEVNEALHLAPREEQTLWELYHQMDQEYRTNQDEYSQGIILTHLASLLSYAQRFYKRQFLNRRPLAGAMVTRFTESLAAYLEGGRLHTHGLPTVKYLAEALHISPRYLTDLLKQETGQTALDHIHRFLVGEAKNLLLGSGNTIAQTAYQLGFENPTYFSRLFKKEIGLTPQQYRARFLN